MTTGGTARRRPNVLYIQSDQHNASVTGCYGDAVVRTPNLDGLAARGVVMDAAYCASPICVPSRMSLITGRYPYENEVWTNDHILDSAIPTYAHSMGAAGYRPVQIGRMHFNGPDQLHGFAERLVGDHSPNYIGSPRPVDHGALEGTRGPGASRAGEVRLRAERVPGARRVRHRRDRRLPQQAGRAQAVGAGGRALLTVGWADAAPPALRRPQGGLRPVRRIREDAAYPGALLGGPPSVLPVVEEEDRHPGGRRGDHHAVPDSLLGPWSPAWTP